MADVPYLSDNDVTFYASGGGVAEGDACVLLAREVLERRRRDGTDHAVIDGQVYEVTRMEVADSGDDGSLLVVAWFTPVAAAGAVPEGRDERTER